jgi:uncharacterized protein (UPF0335 family)
MTRPAGERIAVLETKLDAVTGRLDRLDESNANLSTKLDLILANQAEGSEDRKAIRNEIAQMKPDVQTVADAKRIWKYGRWIIPVVGAGITAIISMKGWLLLNWNYFWSLPPR